MQRHAYMHAGEGRLLQCPCGFSSALINAFEIHLSCCPRAASPCFIQVPPPLIPLPLRSLPSVAPTLPLAPLPPRLPPSVVPRPSSYLATSLRVSSSPLPLRSRAPPAPHPSTEKPCDKKDPPPPESLSETQPNTSDRKYPIRCGVCDKGIHRISNFIAHMKTHDRDRFVVCEYPGCGKKFSSRAKLRRHEATHPTRTKTTEDEQRILRCSHLQCDRMFEQLSDLRRHEQEHHQ